MVAIYAAFVSLLLSHVAHAAPTSSLDSSSFLINGKAAQALNAAFANISSTDSCIDGEMACISNSIAHCANATWQLEACDKSLSCFALPSVKEEGVDISCTTNTTALAIINATGATGGIAVNSTGVPVELPVDCNGDDESDSVDDASGSESSTASVPVSTSASETRASSTRTHKSSQSTTASDSASSASATASSTDVSNSTGSVITVTVTVAPTSTAPTETFTLDPSQASSFLSSIATESGVSITTILPSSTTVASPASTASVASSAVSSAEASSATVISSKQVGIASSPSGSLPAISVGPIKTITLLGQVASTSSAATAAATASLDSGSDGYSY